MALEAVLTLASSRGFSAVEIRALSGDMNLPKTLKKQFGSREHLAAQMAAAEVRVAVVGSSLRLIGATEQQVDDLVEEAIWADALGAKYLRIFDGGEQLTDAELRGAKQVLTYWYARRAHYGLSVDVIVETHDSLADPHNLQRFVDGDLGVALLWDTHHTWRIGGEDPATTWARVAGCAMHLHIKDSVVDATARHGHRYVIPGTGDYPFAALRDALVSSGYAGLVSLEWEAFWHPELPPLVNALAGGLQAGWLHSSK